MYDRAIILGVIVSMLFTELTGLSPAGLIVPGYLAMSLSSPVRIVYTLVISLCTAGLIRLLGRVLILYGRRRFALAILLAYVLHTVLSLSGFLPFRVDIIGCLVPGIMAREFDRQGLIKTLLSLLLVTGILVLILLLFGYPIPGL
ncbi:MAG: poly-gamma-glutamate biosynthesis protein PgsC [Clostridia bacterium]|nr:poly-gamma-glutamate biosynthesis protein PgsC [Clostridia bacterium]